MWQAITGNTGNGAGGSEDRVIRFPSHENTVDPRFPLYQKTCQWAVIGITLGHWQASAGPFCRWSSAGDYSPLP
jgi:hypothetical protein